MKTLTSILLIILFSGVPVIAEEPLASDISWFEGRWLGTSSVADAGMTQHELDFKAVKDKQYLTLSGRHSSGSATQLEMGFLAVAGGTVQWHTASESGMFWMSASAEGGTSLTFSANHLGQPVFESATVTVERIDNDSFRWRGFRGSQPTGNPVADIVYQRVSSAEPLPLHAASLAFEDEPGWLGMMSGTWQADYSLGGLPVTEHVVYTPHASGRFLTVSVDLSFGTMKDSGYGFIGYDPETGRLRSHMVAGIGMVHIMAATDQDTRQATMAATTIGGGLQGDMSITLQVIDSSTIRYIHSGAQMPGGKLIIDYHKKQQ